jgi:membrane glycosyltransferase
VTAPRPDDLRERLRDALGPGLGDLVATDLAGHARLLTTPPMRRATMAPRPLPPLSWRHPWEWLRRRFAVDPSVNAPVPDTGPHLPEPWRRDARRRRLLFLALVAGQTGFGLWLSLAVLPYHGSHWLEPPILAVSAVLMAWVAAGFWMALMGFWVLVRRGDRHALKPDAVAAIPIRANARTAILVPVYNENVRRVFAGVQATYESLRRAGCLTPFDFYILSDSTAPDARAAEIAAWATLCRSVGGFRRIFYRHRRLRIKRKSGNIADWCRRWGRHYRYMVVLDADSVMSGTCLARLVQLMEAHPAAGIIQTVAMPTGRDTLYARIQQFAHRAYAPLFSAGIHYWHLGEAYYWGHNAIIRVEPFMKHCALPTLKRGLLGGEILSHDFVEAALMRRAGWHVWVVYDLPGSWEEMPPTLLEELRRDRRWCHGNLQHSRLFLAQGLHPAHRALFMAGVMSYLSSALWFAFLALSTALLAVHVLVPPVYFTQPFQLFPVWPEWRPHWALGLLAMTTALLLTPKLLAAALLAIGNARSFGGPLRLGAGVLLEIVVSSLLAPIRMLFHTRFVVAALLGLAPRWISPPREDVETTWGEALRHHGGGTVLGVAWVGLVAWLHPAFLVWLLPIAGSLIIAIPLSVWTSRVRLGVAFRKGGLFLTPEEVAPPHELGHLKALVMAAPPDAGAFARTVVEPRANALARGISRPRRAGAAHRERLALAQRAAASGPGVVGDAERAALLGDRAALALLHERLAGDAAARAPWQAEAAPSA